MQSMIFNANVNAWIMHCIQKVLNWSNQIFPWKCSWVHFQSEAGKVGCQFGTLCQLTATPLITFQWSPTIRHAQDSYPLPKSLVINLHVAAKVVKDMAACKTNDQEIDLLPLTDSEPETVQFETNKVSVFHPKSVWYRKDLAWDDTLDPFIPEKVW